MRHVDEGLLHAYIDGAFEAESAERRDIEAHLGACADCRVRLEDARQVRAVAQDVLDAAVPSAVEPPPFETIVAEQARRRGGGGGAGAPAPRVRIPLAWAATVVLALGAGWMARAMVAERNLVPESAAFETLRLQEARDAGSSAESAPPGAPVADASQPATAPPDAAASVAEAPGRGERRTDEAAKAAAAPPPPAVADLGTVRAERLEAARGRAQSLAPAVAARAESFLAEAWVPAGSAAVVVAIGGELVGIEGLEPDSLQLATTGGVTRARSVYVLPEGVVELIQRPAGELTDQDRAADTSSPGDTVLVVRGVEVTLRATSPVLVRDVSARLR